MKRDLIIAAGSVLLGAGIVVLVMMSGGNKPRVVDVGAPDGGKTVTVLPPVKPDNPTKPVETKGPENVSPDEVDRISGKRRITSTFVMSGKGKHSEWGYGVTAGFVQRGRFVADATVVSRDRFGNGRFKLVEDRTFVEARETLEIGDADYFLALDTLPVNEISRYLEVGGRAASMLSNLLISSSLPDLVVAGEVAKGTSSAAQLASLGLKLFKEKNNGKTLKEFGIDVSEHVLSGVTAKLNDFNCRPKEIETMIRSVEGRTYRFTYIQEESGKPLNMTAERVENGACVPVDSDEEVWILCRCNSFIDAEFLPADKPVPSPGDRWSVDSRCLTGVLGLDVEGYCKGSLKCCCDEETYGGSWSFTINPAELQVVDDDGRDLGKISLGGGKGVADKEGNSLRSLAFKGKGKLDRVNRNSILYLPFNESFVGDCEFAGELKTESK